MFSLLMNNIVKLPTKLFIDQWNIAIVARPIHSFLHQGLTDDIKFILNPLRNEFFADPFGITWENKHYVFYEALDYRSIRGVINCAEIDGNKTKRIYYDVLGIAGHASYPFILEHQGGIFCIPEDINSNKLIIYEPIDFPAQWRKAGEILTKFPAADPSIIFFNQRLWLFCTNRNEGAHDKLYVFYADNILGPWHPHPKNPVKEDIESSKSAGTPFIFEEKLFRPAQDCSKEYGEKIVINMIKKLTFSDFVEEQYCVVSVPHELENYYGIHTISQMNNYTLIDLKKRVFSPIALINKAKRSLRNYFKRLS